MNPTPRAKYVALILIAVTFDSNRMNSVAVNRGVHW
jgi:hypothetical protein